MSSSFTAYTPLPTKNVERYNAVGGSPEEKHVGESPAASEDNDDLPDPASRECRADGCTPCPTQAELVHVMDEEEQVDPRMLLSR